MSVKLPNIAINKPDHLQEQQDDYDDQFEPEEHLEEGQKIHHHHQIKDQIKNNKNRQKQLEKHPSTSKIEPIETVISLKSNLKEELVVSVKQTIDADKENNQKIQIKASNAALKADQNKKTELVEELKESIILKKKQLKEIGQKVDRDLNKSMMKAVKIAPISVNIRDIFSAPPTNNLKINKVNDQIKNVRLNIRKIKAEIQDLNNSRNDPISLCNQDRGLELQVKLKEIQDEVKKNQEDRDFLKGQVERAGNYTNVEDDQQREEEFNKIKSSLNEVVLQQKQEKSKLYRMQKQDILLMEKIKFLQQRQFYAESKKRSATIDIQAKVKIDEEIKQIIKQINEILEERNRVEVQKKNQTKHLAIEVSSFQAKNLQAFAKLREYQAFILHYYDKKSRKKEVKVEKTQKSSVSKLEPLEVHVETPKTQKIDKKAIRENDKNISSIVINVTKDIETVLVEKKKNYEFGQLEKTLSNEAILSDEFLGSKNILKKFSLWADDVHLYAIQADYVSPKQQLLKGLHLGAKNKPQNHQQLSIEMDEDLREVINFVHIGFDEANLIRYIHLITSEGREIKWGNNTNLFKSQQKNIRKYEFIYFKAKITMLEELDSMGLSGLAFCTIFLGVK